MNEKITHRRPGFWLLISIGILLNIMYLLGQTMALIDYDFAVSLGLQESSDQITQVGVALNKGFGLGDTVFYMPLFIAGKSMGGRVATQVAADENVNDLIQGVVVLGYPFMPPGKPEKLNERMSHFKDCQIPRRA